MDCSPPGTTVHGILQAKILDWVAMPSSRRSSQPRDRTRSPALQVDSLPSEPPGKPKNTGVGSLSFLQEIFLTQESNWGLLHCSWILYQLSYQGRPIRMVPVSIWRESEIKLFCQLFFCFSYTSQHVGSYFPDQGLNPCPLQWKCKVLTTGPPGKFPVNAHRWGLFPWPSYPWAEAGSH